MKIHNSRPFEVKGTQQLNAYKRNQQTSKNVSAAGDSIQLSSAGKEISKLLKEINELPDIRLEKVAEIKAKYQKGTYQVDIQALANKMTAEILKEDKE